MGMLIKNIRCLVQTGDHLRQRICGSEMGKLNTISDAFLLIKDGKISDYGTMKEYSEKYHASGKDQNRIIDATGRFVFPSFCDPHTHLVFAGSREGEFTDRIRGLSYEEIAKRGGGILNSAKKLRETSEDELFDQSMVRINEIIGLGTGAVEIKSGYGLTTADELKMLRVIRRIRESSPIEVRATFLGAHAVPEEYRTPY